MRYLMSFSYDGASFNGFQRQKDLVTVQGVLEDLLTEVNNYKKVELVASGRTDKGVHARSQVAHFDLDVDVKLYSLIKFLNKRCKGSIYVTDIKIVNNDFHARYLVKNKVYKYYINVGKFNPFMRDYIYQYNKNLDFLLMKDALNVFLGEHDFRSFCMNEKEKENCVRTIYSVNIENIKDVICITFCGNGFLRKMVRNMVGLLIEVGAYKKSVMDVYEILASKGAIHNKKCVPPSGLYLDRVNY